MNKFILVHLLFLLTFTPLHAQWKTTLSVDDTNFYRLLNYGDHQITATAEWSNFVHLTPQGQIERTKQLNEFGFLRSGYTSHQGVWYLGGGCYYVIEDKCPANSLYKSIDQGQSWEKVISEATFSGFGNIVSILSANDNNEVVVLTEYNGVFRINELDGSTEFIQVDSSKKANNYYFGTSSLSGKWTVGFNHIGIPGKSNSTFYQSADQGLSWQEIELPGEDEFILFANYRPDDQLQIITSKQNVYVLKEGQLVYLSTIPLQSENEKLQTQAIPTKLVSYISSFDVVNQVGYIYRSSDGGNSWKIDDTFDSLSVNQMAFIDQNNGLAIANHRNILKRSAENPEETIQSISIFPNPASDQICLDLPIPRSGVSSHEIFIYDSLGKLVRSESLSSPSIDIQNLAIGVYFLRVVNKKDSDSDTFKFCKY